MSLAPTRPATAGSYNVGEMTSLLRRRPPEDLVREAAWIARCIGRADTVPLREADLAALASYLSPKQVDPGTVLFQAGDTSSRVWIIREGTVELVAGAGPRRLVVQVLHSGDVDGDVQLLLGMAFPYTARAASPAHYLFLDEASFDRLLTDHPAVAKRWLSSVAARVAKGQRRVVALLGKDLTTQVARLLAEEESDGRVRLPQRTIAAMLGVHRPSLNKVLKGLERKKLVEVGYREITVLDPAGLERLAE